MKTSCKLGLALIAQAVFHAAIGIMIGGWAGGVLLGASLVSLVVAGCGIPEEEGE